MAGCMGKDQSCTIALQIGDMNSTRSQHEVSLLRGKREATWACCELMWPTNGMCAWMAAAGAAPHPARAGLIGGKALEGIETNIRAGSSCEAKIKDVINSLFKTIKSPISTIRLDCRR